NKQIQQYTVRASTNANLLPSTPRSWDFQGNHADTGSDASWTTLDTGGHQINWAAGQKRTFTVASPQSFRFYRLNIKETANGGNVAVFSELELMGPVGVSDGASNMVLNATAIGSMAKRTKRVIVDTGDVGIEHSLVMDISRG